jgi:hypothetical protein
MLIAFQSLKINSQKFTPIHTTGLVVIGLISYFYLYLTNFSSDVRTFLLLVKLFFSHISVLQKQLIFGLKIASAAYPGYV